jgi:hypothetical protein
MLLAAAMIAPTPSFAEAPLTADISVSSRPARGKPEPIRFDFGYHKAPSESQRASIGTSGGMKEGKKLEMLMWGSGGAVVGSLAGPPGALIGGAVGALCGLVYSVAVVPRIKPKD